MRNRPNNSNKNNHKKDKTSDEVVRFSEDRLQLLDTIHEIVNDELQLRGLNEKGNPHPENPPPVAKGGKNGGKRGLRPSPWQRIKSIFLCKKIEKSNND